MTVWTIIGILFLVLLIGLIIKVMTRVVPHEERLVIYRLGHFHRVAGPGPVMVVPRLDEVKRTYRVRDQPLEITVDGLFPYGVPVGMTLNLWCRFDLEAAAGDDRERLASLVQLSDAERRHQVEIKVREVLVKQIAVLEDSDPLPGDATVIDRVIALAPGTTRYYKLLEAVKVGLREELPLVGAILSPTQTITLTKRDISDEIIQAGKRLRGREIDSEWLTDYADNLRQRFPSISNAVLAQMLASVEGVDAGKVQRLLVEQEGYNSADTEVEVEFEMSGDEERPNVIARPKMKQQRAATQSMPAASRTEQKSTSRTPRPLTESDLAVLKRVPRKDRNQKLSA
jgi:hypothetical protein